MRLLLGGLPADDPEVKVISALATQGSEESSSFLERLGAFSSWLRARRAVALCLQYMALLRSKGSMQRRDRISVEELHRAELKIVGFAQAAAFGDELLVLQPLKGSLGSSKGHVKGTSRLCKLDPFVDDIGILRVGGRLQESSLDFGVKHPIILPKKGHVTELLVRHFHEAVSHQL